MAGLGAAAAATAVAAVSCCPPLSPALPGTITAGLAFGCGAAAFDTVDPDTVPVPASSAATLASISFSYSGSNSFLGSVPIDGTFGALAAAAAAAFASAAAVSRASAQLGALGGKSLADFLLRLLRWGS